VWGRHVCVRQHVRLQDPWAKPKGTCLIAQQWSLTVKVPKCNSLPSVWQRVASTLRAQVVRY